MVKKGERKSDIQNSWVMDVIKFIHFASTDIAAVASPGKLHFQEHLSFQILCGGKCRGFLALLCLL